MPKHLFALLLVLPLLGPPQGAAQPATAQAPAAEPARERLPADRTTPHRIELGDRTLAFGATAGSIPLKANDGSEEAEIAYVAYRLDGADPATRPVTFAVNGGPGAASAYLQLGVAGPWLLPMDAQRIVPSQGVALVPNRDTWLDFTDLVFVDPVGTGFSRLVEPTDGLRDRYLSVEGDIAALADFVLRWLTENGRLESPKFFLGESYGGFRGPLLAEELQTELGVGLDGMTLVSPVLDFGWWLQPDHAPLPKVALLPSLAAAAMEQAGTFSEATLAAAEDYAAGAYLTDLLRGYGDEAAIGRLVERVSALTGIDRATVERAAGRVDGEAFARAAFREDGRRISPYDATVASTDPGRRPRGPDPVLDALTAPLTSAALAHYRDTLRWLPDRRYQLLNGGISRAWDWGEGRGQPQAVDPLADALALDPELGVLVVHGYTDLVTPYFASELILRQLDLDDPARGRTETYRGGHMFYLREDSRHQLREDARRLYEGRTG
jgi:carboxypeptidase C (cathepsin A)